MDHKADPQPIIVGVDGSQSSIDALKMAAELARLLGAPIHAVTVWQVPIGFEGTSSAGMWSPAGEAGRILSEAIQTAFPAGQPENLSRMIVAGHAASVLIKRSEDASMLVVGSRGRGGFIGLLLGSVSTECAQYARCPVLIMRTDAGRQEE